MPTIDTIAAELNRRAPAHPIGALQAIRADLKSLDSQPGDDIFRLNTKTVCDTWACHWGGRPELQFNIGLEDVDDPPSLRHGVALAFETSQNHPSIEPLIPKAALFNDYMRLHAGHFDDMRMWHYQNDERSNCDYAPGPIPPELVRVRVFVFLGKRQPLERIDYEAILSDFDRFLPLYKYVESGGTTPPLSTATVDPFEFRSGCSIKVSSATTTQVSRTFDITLRHHGLQEALYKSLASQFGEDNVGTELPSGVGTSVDVVVRKDCEYWFYEIKTSPSPRACLREAVGQLLEYAFWPRAQEASRLIVVGETALDDDGREYLRRLHERFFLPIEYEQIVM